MTMFRTILAGLVGVLAAGAILFLGGCSKDGLPVAHGPDSKPHGKTPHEHKPGPNGGKVLDVLDKYHVEGVFKRTENEFLFELFTLDTDPNKIMEVEARPLEAEVVPKTGPSRQITLQPLPQTGDKPGKTSRFSVVLPSHLAEQEVDVSILYIMGQERQRIRFTHGKHVNGHGDQAAADDWQLFTTPAGLYTEKDIAANGKTIPSIKFKGIQWPHDNESIKVGDFVCPVTDNKADDRCAWIVNDRRYTFCCEPCIRKFVRWAKDPEDQKKIKQPMEYRATEETVRRLKGQ